MAKRTKRQYTNQRIPSSFVSTQSKTIIKKTYISEKANKLGWLSSLLLIAYGYVSVLTPNWQAYDSNAPKFMTFAALNLMVGGLIFLIKDFRDTNRKTFGFFSNKIGIAYSVMMFFALLSFTKAINTEEAILHFFKIFTPFSAAWIISILIIYNPKSIVPLAIAMTLMIFQDAIYTADGISNIIKGTGLDGDVKGTYSNKNILAAAIFIKLPFAIWLFYYHQGWKRILGGLGVFAGTTSLLFMIARAFYLGIVITMVLLLVHVLINHFINKRKEMTITAGSHFMLVILAFGVFTLVQQIMYPKEGRDARSFTGRLSTITDQEYGSNKLRITAWKTSADMIKKDPLLGVGIGNWKVRYLEYENAISPHYKYMYKVHNDFLEIPTEIGIIGGMAFLSIFVLILIYFIKATYFQKDSKKEKWIFLPLLGLFAYSFDAFFNFPQDRPEIQSLFAIYVGIAVGLGVLFFTKEKHSSSKTNAMLVTMVGILFTSTNFANTVIQKMYFESSKIQRLAVQKNRGVKDERTNMVTADYLIKNYPSIPNLTAVAEPIDVEKARFLIDEKKFEQARKILHSVDYSPWDARKEYYIAVSYFSETEKKFDSIYKYANAARKIKPRFYGMASLETYALNNLGKEDQSIEVWKEFLEQEKNEPQAWNALAHLYNKKNQLEEAQAVLDSALVYFPDNKELVENKNRVTALIAQTKYKQEYDQAMQTYLRGDFPKAIKEFTSFLEKVPNHVEGYGLRAICYYRTGQYQKSLDDMLMQEKLGATLLPIMDNIRGSCYYMLGNKARAKEYYQKGAERGNADSKTNLQRLDFD